MRAILRFTKFSPRVHFGCTLCFFCCLFSHLFIWKIRTYITGNKNEVMMAAHTGYGLMTSKLGRSGDCSDDSFRSVRADDTEAIIRGILSRD